MKYVLLGTLSADWAERHGDRVKQAKAKLAELGIKLESVHYTQGEVDFVDVVDAPSPEAMLAFSIWYANKGLGRMKTMPAYGESAFVAATKKAK